MAIMENKKGIKYKNPPLIEALCEFRFQKMGMVPNIVLGRLYEQIESEFPTVETHKGIGVQSDYEKASPSIVLEERTRFISKDKTRLIQVGEGFLVVNQLQPYKDYSTFRAYVKDIVDIYHKVAKPEGIQSIGLRYINRIEMEQDQLLSEIFNIGFTIPSAFQDFPDPFLLQMEFAYSDGRDKLIVIFATAPSENNKKAIMVNFDYRLIKPDKIRGDLFEWMDEAHDEIEDAFHACLTQKVLERFEPEGDKK
jgi:uncharacterized protein (TIGR04255 family)